jgi:hypothetical protein
MYLCFWIHRYITFISTCVINVLAYHNGRKSTWERFLQEEEKMWVSAFGYHDVRTQHIHVPLCWNKCPKPIKGEGDWTLWLH